MQNFGELPDTKSQGQQTQYMNVEGNRCAPGWQNTNEFENQLGYLGLAR